VLKSHLLVFAFKPMAPLVDYTLEVHLRHAEPDEIDDESENEPKSNSKRPRIVTSAKICSSGEITDPFARGLWNSASLSELVEENFLSTQDTSKTLEEVSVISKQIDRRFYLNTYLFILSTQNRCVSDKRG